MNKTLFLVLAGLAVGCGATVDPQPTQAPTEPAAPDPGTTPDTPPAATPTVDHGKASNKFPAFSPEIGQLVNNGGSVLASPVIVTVTWAGDSNVDTFEQFGDAIGKSSYWKAITSEYGVGAGQSGATNHVRMSDAPPAQISDTELADLVKNKLSTPAGGAGGNGGAAASDAWPAPDDNSVYILYLPKQTDLILQGSNACQQGVGGYHDSVIVNNHYVAYAIVPQCGSLDMTTLSASHELAEAATDPYPRSRPAWTGFDKDHLAWEFFNQFQSENGDACEFYRDAALQGSDVPWTVQRQWSNASAKAGHDPCVPTAPGSVYFNVTPLGTEDVKVDLSNFGAGVVSTKGYTIPVGAKKTIPLGFYSDAAREAWSIQAREGGIYGSGGQGGAHVDLELDVDHGQNGEKAYLTITVNAQGRTKSELVTIVSTAGAVRHYMPILISSP